MHAVGDAIEARRDELARTLTLDQGKPLAAEAYGEVEELVDYWRMAAEDAKRLGGELPNSFSPGKRVMLVRRPLGVVGVISPWNWPYTMPAELIAPALACGNTVVWTPAPSTAVCAAALAAASPRPTSRPASSTSSPAPGPWSATRSPPAPAPTPWPSSARRRRAGSWPRPPPARSRCSRWAATARSS